MILIIFNILVLLSTKEALKCPRKPYSTISPNITLKLHLFSINDLIFETLQDKADPKLTILITFNILLSTKEPLKCSIMKFLVLGEIFMG
ncbi:hypothetical protein AMTRI_Chr05g56820 [Amborella trichopoda]